MYRLAIIVLIIFIPVSSSAQWQPNGVPVSTATEYQADPVIVTDGAGGAIIAWYDYRAGNYDIYAQRLDAAGIPQWTTDGVALCTAPGNQITISMVSDDAGGAVVVWYDARGGSLDIYAQRVNGSGTPLWVADGDSVCTAPGDQSNPIVVKSGANTIVAWHDGRGGTFTDVYAQQLSPAGNPQWTFDGALLCDEANFQFAPNLVADGAGGAIVSWEDYRTGVNDIYAQRVNGSGTSLWTPDGVVVCDAVSYQYRPQPVSDGASGAIIAWYDYRDGNYDVYTQRVDGTGSSMWTDDGVPVCTEPGHQTEPRIASDDAQGALITWQDGRSLTAADIYAQRINSSGAAQWTPGGVAICTASDDQQYPVIIADGAGGAFVAWFDLRAGDPDRNIYVQRVSASGAAQWAPDGVAICTAPDMQEIPMLVSDGSGGAIVTWRDRRDGQDYDVYAERVNGAPVGVAHMPLAALQVRPGRPNPFSSATTIDLDVPAATAVDIDVFDVTGRRVRHIDVGRAPARSQSVTFDGRDEDGQLLPSGVYFFRVGAAGQTMTRKLVIAR